MQALGFIHDLRNPRVTGLASVLRNRLLTLEKLLALVAHDNEFADIGVVLQNSQSQLLMCKAWWYLDVRRARGSFWDISSS